MGQIDEAGSHFVHFGPVATFKHREHPPPVGPRGIYSIPKHKSFPSILEYSYRMYVCTRHDKAVCIATEMGCSRRSFIHVLMCNLLSIPSPLFLVLLTAPHIPC